MFSVCNYIVGGGLFTTFADFIENYRYILLKHERYCEHFLEIMLHVFIDILCIIKLLLYDPDMILGT